MGLFRKLSIVFASVIMFGCASPAQVDNMRVDHSVNMNFDKSLADSIKIDDVEGGEETNPMWTSEVGNKEFKAALNASLKSQGLLSETNKSGYELTATLVESDQPLFGADFEVTLSIRYILIEMKNDKVIFNKVIKTPYTATMGDSLLGVKRLRLANEGSAKKNITELLNILSKLKMEKDDIKVVSTL